MHHGSTGFFKFRDVSGSLGQIRLGLLKGSAEGSTKAAPRFHQGSTKVAQVLGCQKVLWKVPAMVRQGSTKVLQVSLCLWSFGADPFWGAKRFFGRSPHHFFKLVSQFLNSFLHFSPTAPALGYSAILKALGQNYTFVFLGSLRQMAFASQKVIWFPKHFFALVSQSPAFFWQMAAASERFCGGFRQLLYSLHLSQMAVAS